MTFNFGRTSLLLAALTGLGASLCAPAAHAWPTTSPSAKSAARLKYHPPKNWLQHYLPDDRYKIAGGVWKVVSTQYDTYYHRPDSQYMLRQPAGIVIGFASEQEAKEAGYRAAGAFEGGVAGGSGGKATVTLGRGRRKVTVRGTRVSLSDGSTVLLPDGWTVRRGGTHTSGEAQMAFDLLSNTSRPAVMLSYFSVSSPKANFGSHFNARTMRKSLEDMNKNLPNALSSGGQVTNRFGNVEEIFKNMKVSEISLGGMSGVKITSSGPVKSVSAMAARGTKMHGFSTADTVYSSPQGRAIIQSFRPA